MAVRITYSEDDLIALIRQNSKKGFDYLYVNYGAALRVVIGKIITDKHTAEDVLQEVFVNVWVNVHQFDQKKGRLYTWMRNIAVNKCKDFLRSGIHNMRSKTQSGDEELLTTAHKTEQKTDRIGINQMVGKLHNDHYTVIRMAYYQGYTFEEMSKKLNIPLGTVKSRMRRAISMLRATFEYV